MNRVDRLMGYLLLFQSRGLMRAQDFAEQFEISERTVYRDIQALSEVGVPIMAMPGEGYRLMQGYYLPPISFTPSEARSLHLAISMLTGVTTPGETQSAAATALEKIRAVLPAETLEEIEARQAMLRFYAFPSPPLDFDDEMFVAIQQAIRDQRVIRLYYHALHSNNVTERDVEPSELVCLDRIWILTAYCRLRQDSRAFRLNRIDDLTITAETFTPRDLGDLRFQPQPLRIVVRFDAEIVRWVQERQHFSFVEEYAADNDATIIVYQPRSFAQIEAWLLGWGGNMTVLEPVALRERLAEVASAILDRHGGETK